jgi:long-chain acyl-CoA synthetase
VGQLTSAELAREVEGQTVATRFRDTVRARPDAIALRCRSADGWATTTWSEYADQACRLAAGLRDLGVSRGDRVALMMRNRPEFSLADMAVLLVGGTPISIYNSSSVEQVRYLVGHCGARLAIVEDDGFLERFTAARADLPNLRDVILIEGGAHPSSGALIWSDVIGAAPVDLDSAAAVATPEDLATVIYTSGTTGQPKGVMIDHANVCWTSESLRRCLYEIDVEGSRVVSYLPMAHIAERMTSHYQGACFGYEITTCPDAAQVGQYLAEIHPEIFFAVPRVWEKMHSGVLAVVEGDPDRKAQLEAALGLGLKVSDCRASGSELPTDLAEEWERVDAGGLAAVRTLLGLDQCTSAISGAAPLAVEIFDFFRALGVPISEIYGLSETTGPMVFEAFRVKAGTVGRVIPGGELRLGDDGEVLCRGGNIFRGYLDDPEKTAEAVDVDGWLHTGDIGVLDEDGYLRIVDRKKELIITAGGKNISPANLESALKAELLIGQACVIGDKRPFVSALVVLDPEVTPAWASQHGIEASSVAELADHPEVRAELDREVAHAMEPFNNAERVKKFAVLHEEWLPDSEVLTPTAKLKRRGVYGRYGKEIESLYA